MTSGGAVRFGDVVVSFDRHEVIAGDTVQHLEPQAFDLLRYLIANAERVVPKHELLDEVWGHRFVTEAALTTRVKQIRQAVGDTGRDQAVIRTVRRHGYQFVATATSAAEPAPAHSHLLGRDDDVTRVTSLLASSRLVTLIGPGGVGKTSLAERIAEISGRAVVVPLAAVDDADAVLAAWRAASGLSSSSTSDAEALVGLADRDVLHVLDNCEHVLDEIARLLTTMPAGPARFLATSRERLGVPGEQLFRVEPLPPDAARALFVESAFRSRPDLRLGEEHRPAVDALVASVDRLPLAIEMAAGRVAAIGLADLAALLIDAPERLGTSRRGVVERHRSISDLIEWSVRMLSPEERRVLDDLSVFAGPVGLEDVVGVVGRDGGAAPVDRVGTVDALVSLVERSLVMADTGRARSTYRLLETTRAHVRSGRQGSTDATHAHWFVEQAEQLDRDLRTPGEAEAHERMTSIVDELRRAHRWADEHDPGLAARLGAAMLFWAVTRLNGEMARWARATYDRLAPGDPGRDHLAAHIAADAAHRGDYALAVELASEAAASDATPARMAGLDTLINTALYLGDLDASERRSRELHALADATTSRAHHIQAVIGAALTAHHRGEPGRAAALLDGYEVPDDLSPTELGWLHHVRAEINSLTAPLDAVDHHRRAFDLARSVDSRFLASASGASLADLTGRVGDAADAFALYRTVLSAQRRDGNLTHATFTLQSLVAALARHGLDEAAMRLFGAVSGDRFAWSRWADAAERAEARSAVESRVGHAAATRWIDEGAAITSPYQVLDLALGLLADRPDPT